MAPTYLNVDIDKSDVALRAHDDRVIGAATTLPLPTLIACLQERIIVLREADGAPIPIGGLAELLEQTVQHLQTLDAADAKKMEIDARLACMLSRVDSILQISDEASSSTR